MVSPVVSRPGVFMLVLLSLLVLVESNVPDSEYVKTSGTKFLINCNVYI